MKKDPKKKKELIIEFFNLDYEKRLKIFKEFIGLPKPQKKLAQNFEFSLVNKILEGKDGQKLKDILMENTVKLFKIGDGDFYDLVLAKDKEQLLDFFCQEVGILEEEIGSVEEFDYEQDFIIKDQDGDMQLRDLVKQESKNIPAIIARSYE